MEERAGQYTAAYWKRSYICVSGHFQYTASFIHIIVRWLKTNRPFLSVRLTSRTVLWNNNTGAFLFHTFHCSRFPPSCGLDIFLPPETPTWQMTTPSNRTTMTQQATMCKSWYFYIRFSLSEHDSPTPISNILPFRKY